MLWFDLALALGCSVREAQARIDSAEFAEWAAYQARRPFGPATDDLRHGMLCALIDGIMKGKNQQRKAPRDFMLGQVVRRRQSAGEMMAIFRTAASRSRGK